MPETSFDHVSAMCALLIKQRQALLDGLHELADKILQPGNQSKEELMKIITDTFKKEAEIK